MKQKQYNFSIIFDELEKISKDPTFLAIKEKTKECEEIQAIREIVHEIHNKPRIYLTST